MSDEKKPFKMEKRLTFSQLVDKLFYAMLVFICGLAVREMAGMKDSMKEMSSAISTLNGNVQSILTEQANQKETIKRHDERIYHLEIRK